MEFEQALRYESIHKEYISMLTGELLEAEIIDNSGTRTKVLSKLWFPRNQEKFNYSFGNSKVCYKYSNYPGILHEINGTILFKKDKVDRFILGVKVPNDIIEDNDMIIQNQSDLHLTLDLNSDITECLTNPDYTIVTSLNPMVDNSSELLPPKLNGKPFTNLIREEAEKLFRETGQIPKKSIKSNVKTRIVSGKAGGITIETYKTYTRWNNFLSELRGELGIKKQNQT